MVIDFVGKVDGEAFDGGTGEGMAVVLGSGQLIPGFEEQMVGLKAGDEKQLNVTFPADYQAENLKGKPATFDVKVKAVKTAGETKVDDEFAKQLGLNDLEQLKGLLRDQQQQELNGLTRTHMKRRLLDQLAADHDFDVPPSMVEAEYENIMAQLRHEASHEADPEAALKEIEADAEDYRKHRGSPGPPRPAAVRDRRGQRHRGQPAGNEPADRPGCGAISAQGPRAFVHYVQQKPMAAAQLRAPLYEDKVVDFLFSKAEISDRTVTRAELEADLESEEGHVHGPGCGHDHGEAKPRPRRRLPRRPAGQRKEAAEPAKAEQAVPSRRRSREEGRAEGRGQEAAPAKQPPPRKPGAKDQRRL